VAIEVVEEAGFVAVDAGNADEAVALLESRSDIAVLFTDIDISHILGANRKSVALAAQAMQTAGLISYPPEFLNSTVQYQKIICVISALHRKVEYLSVRTRRFSWGRQPRTHSIPKHSSPKWGMAKRY
jgi:hypothetical protein